MLVFYFQWPVSQGIRIQIIYIKILIKLQILLYKKTILFNTYISTKYSLAKSYSKIYLDRYIHYLYLKNRSMIIVNSIAHHFFISIYQNPPIYPPSSFFNPRIFDMEVSSTVNARLSVHWRKRIFCQHDIFRMV